MVELIVLVKDLLILLFLILLGSILLYFISGLFMLIIKTLFFDTQIKLIKVWNKRLKNYTNNVEIEKVLNEIQKKI